MKLFLASQAKHPESIKKLKEFIGGDFKGKKIAYIPTAANGEGYGSWKKGESIQVAKNLGADLKTVELEDVYHGDILAPIKKAEILWMAGGQSGYLLYWLRRSELDKILPDLLGKGLVYVGSSAGSMVCAKTQSLSDWYLDEPEPGASLLPGLGLINFEIYPHYEDELLPEIKKRWVGGKL